MSLSPRPIAIAVANEWVREMHRHHRPVVGAKFCIAAVSDSGGVVGVVIVGRPVARSNDDGLTAEVTRCCTDGTRNACSFLYRAAWRAASAMGYRRLITYTLATESGASLRGAGFRLLGVRGGGSWNCPSRPRIDNHPVERKCAWEIDA
jgi:hypothetical protein